MKREYIQKVFTDLNLLKTDGIYFSGIKGEGEFKRWWSSGGLSIQCSYKWNLREGEYKAWYPSGQLSAHRLYKDGKIIKDYLK